MYEMELCLVAARHTILLLILPKICKSIDAHACRTSNDITDYRSAVCLGYDWQNMRCLYVDVIFESRHVHDTYLMYFTRSFKVTVKIVNKTLRKYT